MGWLGPGDNLTQEMLKHGMVGRKVAVRDRESFDGYSRGDFRELFCYEVVGREYLIEYMEWDDRKGEKRWVTARTQSGNPKWQVLGVGDSVEDVFYAKFLEWVKGYKKGKSRGTLYYFLDSIKNGRAISYR